MLFFTLWDREGGKAEPPEAGKSHEFAFTKESGVSESFYCCERTGEGKYLHHGFTNMAEMLRENDRSQILLYIHGFNNLPEPHTFPNAKTLQHLLDKHPGLENDVTVIPIIWPCADRVGIVRDYFTDQDAADMSGLAISRALQKFIHWQSQNNERDVPCLKRINILAHSMGNRVLLQSLANFRKSSTSGAPQLFRNIFMVAPDVENEVLERDQPGHTIAMMAKTVTVYYANDDMAMPAGKIANVRNGVFSKRLGLSGPEKWGEEYLPHNVYAVDCDSFNSQYRDIKGHTYFLDDKEGNPGKAFSHIAETLSKPRFSRDPNERHIILD